MAGRRRPVAVAAAAAVVVAAEVEPALAEPAEPAAAEPQLHHRRRAGVAGSCC